MNFIKWLDSSLIPLSGFSINDCYISLSICWNILPAIYSILDFCKLCIFTYISLSVCGTDTWEYFCQMWKTELLNTVENRAAEHSGKQSCWTQWKIELLNTVENRAAEHSGKQSHWTQWKNRAAEHSGKTELLNTVEKQSCWTQWKTELLNTVENRAAEHSGKQSCWTQRKTLMEVNN